MKLKKGCVIVVGLIVALLYILVTLDLVSRLFMTGDTQQKNSFRIAETKATPKTVIIKRNVTVEKDTSELERTIRETQRVYSELWNYMTSETGKIAMHVDKNTSIRIGKFLRNARGYNSVIRGGFANLTNSTEASKMKMSYNLGLEVQQWIDQLQNPLKCESAKLLVCTVKLCGFGCQLHHFTYCLLVASGMGRTLVMRFDNWMTEESWHRMFQPVAKTCSETSHLPSLLFTGGMKYERIEDVQVIELESSEFLLHKPSFLPPNIHKNFATRISRFHGYPATWWVGQFVIYLTRPTEYLQAQLDKSGIAERFKHPIVGVHVRRTDKVSSEAVFHHLSEYIAHVNDWYDAYETTHGSTRRRIFLASDDPAAYDEAVARYPHYDIVSEAEITKMANPFNRHEEESFLGIIHDIYFLSRVDHLVCTFSSGVCRVAYEIMQTIHGDASTWVQSLDDVYFFSQQLPHCWEAIREHTPTNDQEIELKAGDCVDMEGNHWDGYAKGTNQRTLKRGLFPAYKVVNRQHKPRMPMA